METYSLSIGNLTRNLPIVEPFEGLRYPLVEFLGDVELTQAATEALAWRIPSSVQWLFTVETSSIPVVHLLAAHLKIGYVVVRRRRRAYLEDPIIQPVNSMTLGAKEVFWLDRRLAEKLYGQQVAIVLDVVSTGATMEAMSRMVRKAGGVEAGRFAVFQQGTPVPGVTAAYDLPVFRP
jgi:adenine phosphoribosyltransferase